MAATIHTITIPSSTRFLEDVREFVKTHALAANFSDEDVEELKIAVDECCTNVIEHAYGNDASKTIDIAVLVDDRHFSIRIRDEGRAFDASTYREPDLAEFAKNRKSGGFGVHIMRKLMDAVTFSTRNGTNECLMVKER
ncbi:MAG: ATP-binding protein [Rhodothermales bacterium]